MMKPEKMKPIDTVVDAPEMTEEEVESLRSLLRQVYPDPPSSIRENVMATIRAEKTAQAEKEAALAAQNRRDAGRRRRALFMKWGGMAACVTILCGALAIASPLMERSALSGTADQEAYAMDMAVAETRAETRMAEAPTEMMTEASGGTTEGGAVEKEEQMVYRSMLMTADVTTDVVEAEGDMDVTETEETVSQTTAAPEEVKAAKLYGTANGISGDPTRENMAVATPEQREAFLQWLVDTGRLDMAVYQAWMDERGYTDVSQWDGTELCEAFGLDVSLIDEWAKQ